MSQAIPLSEQATEVELHYLGLRDLHARAANGKIRRSPHDVDGLRARRDAAEAAYETLRGIASHTGGA